MATVTTTIQLDLQDNVSRKMKMVGDSIGKNLSKKLGKVGDRMKFIKRQGASMTGLFAGIFSTVAVTQFIQKLIETERQLQKIEQTAKTAAGSNIGGQQNIEFARGISDELGLNFLQTAEDFNKFGTAARLAGLESEQSKEIFESLSIAVAGNKLSADDARGAFKAFEQILSKGKVQAEELRGQLGERIPGAFAIMAKAIGVTQEELNKMLERGEVLANDVMPKFAKELRNTFSDAAIEGSRSLNATLNRLTNTIDNLFISLNRDSPFLDALNSVISAVTDFISGDVGAGLKAVLTPIFRFIADNAKTITAIVSGIVGTVGVAGITILLAKLAGVIASIGTIAGTAIFGLGSLVTGLVLLKDELVDIEGVILPLKDIVASQFREILSNFSGIFASFDTSSYESIFTQIIVSVGESLVKLSEFFSFISVSVLSFIDEAAMTFEGLAKVIGGEGANSFTLIVTLAAGVIGNMAAGLLDVTNIFVLLTQTVTIATAKLVDFLLFFKSLAFTIATLGTNAVFQEGEERESLKENLSFKGGNSIRGAADSIGEFSKKLSILTPKLRNLDESVIKFFENVDEGIKRRLREQAVSDIISDRKGIDKTASSVEKALKEAVSGAIDTNIDIDAVARQAENALKFAEKAEKIGVDSSRLTENALKLGLKIQQLASIIEDNQREKAIIENNKAITDLVTTFGSFSKGDFSNVFEKGIEKLQRDRDIAFSSGDFDLSEKINKAIQDTVENIKSDIEFLSKESVKLNAEANSGIIAAKESLQKTLEDVTKSEQERNNKINQGISFESKRINALKALLEAPRLLSRGLVGKFATGTAGAFQRAAEIRDKQRETANASFRKNVETLLEKAEKHLANLAKAAPKEKEVIKGIVR